MPLYFIDWAYFLSKVAIKGMIYIMSLKKKQTNSQFLKIIYLGLQVSLLSRSLSFDGETSHVSVN